MFYHQSTAYFLEFDIPLSSVLFVIEMFCEKNWLILTFEVVNGDFSYYDCD